MPSGYLKDLEKPGVRSPVALPIAAATFLYTVSSPVGTKQTGCTIEELQRAVLTLDTDINDFTQALRALDVLAAQGLVTVVGHDEDGRLIFAAVRMALN